MASDSLVKHISNYRVSSVLNRDVTSLGKQNLFDGNVETCWNSEQGTPQHILVEFAQPVYLRELHVQFQGGFAGSKTRLIDVDCKRDICPLFFEDNNALQTAKLPAAKQNVARRRIKLQFVSSTDFYGRIIVYSLDFRGSVAGEDTANGETARLKLAEGGETAEPHVTEGTADSQPTGDGKHDADDDSPAPVIVII
ncbi:Nuclear receptor 2C2-associated protein [Coemansia sp. RSA 2705]|nr:Nuclear receptor 2C2-associated protein [Coemansia sp. RSA 2705]